MDFTREPIIETVITPKEGCKLVVRSSKGVGQEEYFVDAVEVVAFGKAIFFRSQERPKAFIVPATDYEVLEVREARIVLKNVGLDRSIKIAGGREAVMRAPKEAPEEKEASGSGEGMPAPQEASAGRFEGRGGKRERRRGQRRRRGDREDAPIPQEGKDETLKLEPEERINISAPEKMASEEEVSQAVSVTGSLLSTLLAPPPLISETISRYREKFKDAFYSKEEEANIGLGQTSSEGLQQGDINIVQPEFGSFEMNEEGEEEIYRQRHRNYISEVESEEAPQPTPETPEESKPSEEQPTTHPEKQDT